MDLVFLPLQEVPQFQEFPEHLCHPVVRTVLWDPSLPSAQAFQEGQEVLSLPEIQAIQRVRVDLADLAGLEVPEVFLGAVNHYRSSLKGSLCVKTV